jgi:hypothetical protein
MNNTPLTRRKLIGGIAAVVATSGCTTVSTNPSENQGNITAVERSQTTFDHPSDQITFTEAPEDNVVHIDSTVVLHNGCEQFKYTVDPNEQTTGDTGIFVDLYSVDNSTNGTVCTAVIRQIPTRITLNFEDLVANQTITVSPDIGGETTYTTTGDKNTESTPIPSTDSESKPPDE